VEIEPASEDWWQGKDKHGNTGLFPGKLYCVLRFLAFESDADVDCSELCRGSGVMMITRNIKSGLGYGQQYSSVENS